MTRKLELSGIDADRRRMRIMYVGQDGHARSWLASAATMRLTTWLSDEATAAFIAQTWRDTFQFKRRGVPFAFRREKVDVAGGVDGPSVAVDDWVFFAGKPGERPDETWLPPDSNSAVYVVGKHRILGGKPEPEPEPPAATAEEFNSSKEGRWVVQFKWTDFLGDVKTSTLLWDSARQQSADEVAEWLRTVFPSLATTTTEYRFGIAPTRKSFASDVGIMWTTLWNPLPKPGSAKSEPEPEPADERDPGWRSRPGVEAGV